MVDANLRVRGDVQVEGQRAHARYMLQQRQQACAALEADVVDRAAELGVALEELGELADLGAVADDEGAVEERGADSEPTLGDEEGVLGGHGQRAVVLRDVSQVVWVVLQEPMGILPKFSEVVVAGEEIGSKWSC